MAPEGGIDITKIHTHKFETLYVNTANKRKNFTFHMHDQYSFMLKINCTRNGKHLILSSKLLI